MRHNKVKIVWSIVAILLLVLGASVVYIHVSDAREQKQIVEDGEALGFDFEAHEDKPHESTKEFEKAVDAQDTVNADDSEDTKSETVIENESDASSVSTETNDKNESDVSYDNSESILFNKLK